MNETFRMKVVHYKQLKAINEYNSKEDIIAMLDEKGVNFLESFYSDGKTSEIRMYLMDNKDTDIVVEMFKESFGELSDDEVLILY